MALLYHSGLFLLTLLTNSQEIIPENSKEMNKLSETYRHSDCSGDGYHSVQMSRLICDPDHMIGVSSAERLYEALFRSSIKVTFDICDPMQTPIANDHRSRSARSAYPTPPTIVFKLRKAPQRITDLLCSDRRGYPYEKADRAARTRHEHITQSMQLKANSNSSEVDSTITAVPCDLTIIVEASDCSRRQPLRPIRRHQHQRRSSSYRMAIIYWFYLVMSEEFERDNAALAVALETRVRVGALRDRRPLCVAAQRREDAEGTLIEGLVKLTRWLAEKHYYSQTQNARNKSQWGIPVWALALLFISIAASAACAFIGIQIESRGTARSRSKWLNTVLVAPKGRRRRNWAAGFAGGVMNFRSDSGGPRPPSPSGGGSGAPGGTPSTAIRNKKRNALFSIAKKMKS